MTVLIAIALLNFVGNGICATSGNECGRNFYAKAVSETEKKFFRIRDSLPPIDLSNPESYDPPLDLSVTPMLIPPVSASDTIEGKYPWMVAIFKGSSFLCGGTLIDRIHILSAAQCFVNPRESIQPDPSQFHIRVGSIHVNKGYPIDIAKITIHEQYNLKTFSNDIAILTLEKEILTPRVAHICLPDIDLAARNLTGEKATLLGWGAPPFGGRISQGLREARNIIIISDKQCRSAYQKLMESVPDDIICTSTTGEENIACQLVGGGPLMYENGNSFVLVGIFSLGTTCGMTGYPDVHTRVSNYMDWIKKNTE